MEETMGKRIAALRKRAGLTQDKLAEALGVTAQAVSKWENDQSCPDIATLPRLAEIFGVTTDALLGVAQKEVHPGEVIPSDPAQETDGDGPSAKGSFELQWDGGRKSTLGLALWVIASGSLLLLSNHFGWELGLYHILWTSGLTLFGLFGLYPQFSVFRLCCALLGGYCLYNEIRPIPFARDYLLPVFLLLFGLSLLLTALKKPRHSQFHVTRNGKTITGTTSNHCECDETSFSCSASFGKTDYPIQVPRLTRGEGDVSFGEMTLDLRGCEEAGSDCRLKLNCAFGQLTLLVPRRFRIEPEYDAAFGSIAVDGEPLPSAAVITAECSVSFGQITVRYL